MYFHICFTIYDHTLYVGRCVHFKYHFPTWYGQTCTQTEKPRYCVQPYHTEISKRHFPLHLSEDYLLLNKYCGSKVIHNIYLQEKKECNWQSTLLYHFDFLLCYNDCFHKT